jgi:hypothetical protein
MFKQVLTKLFSSDSLKSSSSNQNVKTYPHRPPIYNPVPTISSCFQQQSSIASDSLLANYYNNTDTTKSNHHTPRQIQMSKSSSGSSISPSSTRSVNSRITSNSKVTSKNNLNPNSTIAATPPPLSTSNLKNTEQIYIAPHCIKYTNSTLDDTIYRIDDESLNEIATEILESESSPPKLQIVFYDNKYFAINNSHLQIYKQMQYVGLITHVQADVISVEAIPLPLRKHLLQTPSNLASSNSDEDEDAEGEEEDEGVNTNNDSFESGKNSRCRKLGGTSSSTSSGIISDIITQANVERLSKCMLVDETYEFGLSENCIESDLEDKDKEDEDDPNYGEEEEEGAEEEEEDEEESNEEDDEDECEIDDENLPSFEKVRMINKLIAQKLLEETRKTQKESVRRVNSSSTLNESQNFDNLFKNVNEVYTSEDLEEDCGK